MEPHTRRMLGAALAVTLFCILLFWAGVFYQYQLRLADALYGGKQPLDNIVIVGIDDKSLQELGRWPWPRERFVPLVENLDEASVIGIDIAYYEPSGSRADALFAAAIRDQPVVLVSEYVAFTDGIRLLKPSNLFKAETGHANIVTDSDGVVRALNLDMGDEQAFSASVYELYTNESFPRQDRFLINFAGPPRTFKYYSATDIIKGRIPKSEFEDKIVLIGAVARDFHDDAIVPTSSGNPMPGVEIHANALQTMLLDNELQEMPAWITLFAVVAISFLLAFLILRVSGVIVGIVSVLLIIAYIALCFNLFERGIVPNIFFIPFVIVFSFIVFVVLDLVNERMVRYKVAEAFGKYVSPALADEIMRKGVVLGGERKELTILFSDIRGFTSISEKLTPEELVDFLNSYFTRVTGIIMDEHGLVDKFIGDAIMAFWNAPVTERDHADRAVATALAMREVLHEVRREHAGKYPNIEIGIGINTGDAVVGNVGSLERLSYTAIGDSVNLASRLEGLTKEYGVQILISENTKKKLKKEVLLRELDRVKVKGKKEPVTIYEVVGFMRDASKEEVNTVDAYHRALKLYYKGKWHEASRAFSRLDDYASKMMVKRCAEYVENPPSHWDGSHEMKTK